MNSVINFLLFFVFLLMLLVSFFAVNVYVNKLTFADLQVYFANPFKKKLPKELESKPLRTSLDNILTSMQTPTFSYPSSEIFITLDFSSTNKTDILEIKNLDSYKLFCLKEILKSNDIKFTYKQEVNMATLEVALKDSKQKNSLVNDLKKYNIDYKFKKG